MSRAIPLVDLQQFINGSEAEKTAFVDTLGKAFHEFGFVGVKNHGIDNELVEQFYTKSYSFFNKETSVKEKYKIKGLAGQRGYTSFGTEHAKQSDVPDLKEFFQIGQTVEDDDPIRSEYPANVIVDEIDNFTQTGIRLYKNFERSGAYLLEAVALHLGLDKEYFKAKIHNGNSILRAIHYPPITREPDSAIRAESHEDINLITLLVGASAGGLQIFTKQGEWKDILPEEGEIVINVGDMLQRLTNDYLKSTTHRVVNPPKELWHTPRLSIPFFLHPRQEMDLTCLDSCVTEAQPLQYEAITAGEYLDQRLREIGLKK